MVANVGVKADWKTVAARNGIENPRNLAPGTLVNLRGSVAGGGLSR
jgi:hypothetical protein